MEDEDKRALDNIEKYGCHILQIMEGEFNPPFSYSIGIQKTSNAPELIIVGLKNNLSGWIINEYCRRVSNGERFIENRYYEGFIGGFSVTFKKVNKEHYKEYLGWALWLYKNDNFEVLQMIYPTTSGVWPWDPQAPQDFLESIRTLYDDRKDLQ